MEKKPDFIVRVKFQNKKQFLPLFEEEVNWKTFVDKGKLKQQTHLEWFVLWRNSLINFSSGLLLFGVQIYKNATVYLTDNTGTDIPTNLFDLVLKKYWNGSNFYIEIKYATDENGNIDLVTPEVNNFIHLCTFVVYTLYLFVFFVAANRILFQSPEFGRVSSWIAWDFCPKWWWWWCTVGVGDWQTAAAHWNVGHSLLGHCVAIYWRGGITDCGRIGFHPCVPESNNQ